MGQLDGHRDREMAERAGGWWDSYRRQEKVEAETEEWTMGGGTQWVFGSQMGEWMDGLLHPYMDGRVDRGVIRWMNTRAQ